MAAAQMTTAPNCKGRLPRMCLLLLVACVSSSAAHDHAHDVSHTVLETDAPTTAGTGNHFVITGPTARLLRHLSNHVQRRSGLAGWGSRASPLCGKADQGQCSLLRLVATSAQQSLSPGSFRLTAARTPSAPGSAPFPSASKFLGKIPRSSAPGAVVITIAAGDDAGLRAGIGRLAREIRISASNVTLPHGLVVAHDGAAALWPLRGHQYTAAHHPSMFKTWDEFDAFTHDNAAFGMNQANPSCCTLRPRTTPFPE